MFLFETSVTRIIHNQNIKRFLLNYSFRFSVVINMASKRALKCLTIPQKVEIIKKVKSSSKTKKDIAKEFDIPVSTLCIILENEEK